MLASSTSSRLYWNIRDHVRDSPVAEATLDWLRGRAKCLTSGLPSHIGDDGASLFFIIGSGRSGTTLLRRILLTSPEIYIPPELLGLGDAVQWYRRHAYMDWPGLVAGSLAKIQFHPSYQYVGVDLTPVYREMCNIAPGERSLSRLLLKVYDHLAKSSGRTDVSLYGDKTPALTLHVWRINAVFGQARFIHVVRDPVDVVASFVERGMRDVHSASRLWVRRTRSARKLQRVHSERCLTVRYEELVANPEGVADNLATFLSIPREGLDVYCVQHASDMGDVSALPHHGRVETAITTTRVGWGRDFLTSQDIERVREIVQDEGQHWGYSVV